jgi:4-diphosphocytidyl-2-C-methyl-D-erythritol kinase
MSVNDESVQVRAPAKINLSFRIARKREDGFHEIETLMAPISLADELEIVRAGRGIDFACDESSLPSDTNNLVVRAAQRFFDCTGAEPAVQIALRKRIPHGAGLGGGSSDAASTLLALNQLFASPLSSDELLRLAAQIGSDVPFFIVESAAICRGRGEVVSPLSQSPRLRLLLAKPEFAVPTPEAYARWQSSRELPDVDYAPQKFSGVEFINDLERPVFEKYPFLGRLKVWLREQPEVGAALLSGSGSTVFAALRDDAAPDALAQRIRAECDPKLWTCAAETL